MSNSKMTYMQMARFFGAIQDNIYEIEDADEAFSCIQLMNRITSDVPKAKEDTYGGINALVHAMVRFFNTQDMGSPFYLDMGDNGDTFPGLLVKLRIPTLNWFAEADLRQKAGQLKFSAVLDIEYITSHAFVIKFNLDCINQKLGEEEKLLQLHLWSDGSVDYARHTGRPKLRPIYDLVVNKVLKAMDDAIGGLDEVGKKVTEQLAEQIHRAG